MAKNTIIDGIAASEHLDSSGESLSIEGMDISSLGGPDSILNWEHGSKDRPSQVVGKVTFAKKLLKAADAKTKREKYFWNKVKKPMVYIKAELFDGIGHSGAQDVAAMLKYKNKDKGEDSRLVVGFSIEGGKMEKKGMVVTKSIARDVAITVKPCNKICDAELIEGDVDEDFLYKNQNFECEIFKNTEVQLNKSFRNIILEDIKKSLPSKDDFNANAKRMMETNSFKQKGEIAERIADKASKPLNLQNGAKTKRKFDHKTKQPDDEVKKDTITVKEVAYNRKSEVFENEKNNMRKALMAGMMGGSPDSKTGVAALAQEDLSGTLEKPFKSKKQRRFAHANPEKFGGKEGIKEWEKETPKNIPEKVKKNTNYTHKRMKKSEGNNILSRVKLNPDHGKMIAEAYHNMKHTPDDENTKNAYNALINETHQQFKKLMDGGLKISRIKPGQENPYKNSKELHNDIINNNHLWYFPTDQGYGSDNKEIPNHPLLQGTGYMHDDNELLANDMFRIVHDINGHHIGGQSGFGPTGEHRAFLTHRQMYSPLAQKALASETLGQNSWVNFGPHGEHNRANPSQTIYADQKAGLLPDEIVYGDWHLNNELNKNEKLEKMSRPLMINKELGLGQDPRMDVKTIDPEKTYTTKKGKTISAPELESKKIQQQYRNKEKEISNLKPGYDFTPKAQKEIGEYQKRFKVNPETAKAANIYDPDYGINRSYVYKQKKENKNEIGPELHETTHAFFSDIASKHGENKSNKLSRHLLDSFFHPKDLQKIKDFVSSRYPKEYAHHQEEHITHISDVLNRPSVRKEFLKQHSNTKKLGPNPSPEDLKLAQDLDRRTYKRLASGWSKSVDFIKNSKKLSNFLK
jgi:hypothetical protein